MADHDTVLLDIDGTLVDSNYHHTLAWHRAFARAGLIIPMTDIHRTIGMGGDHLIERLAPGLDEPVEAWWREEFVPLRAELTATPGAAALVRYLHQAGAATVYATSGNPEDVGVMRRIIAADPWITSAVNSSEVPSTKPAPDIFQLAMARAGSDRDRTFVIGDSTWDVEAAIACRIRCVALTCGGISAAELEAAGAIATYRTPQDLLDDIGSSPLAELLH